MKLDSCFNFKISKCIGVFGSYIQGVVNCNDGRTEIPRMHKYGESKMTRIMMPTVCHVTSSSGVRKFQAT
jgi:hypothetical protein